MVSPVKAAVQDIKRLRDITGVLSRHGFHAVVRRAGLSRFVPDEHHLLEAHPLKGEESETLLGGDVSGAAVRFRRVLEDLGPTFVKLGQIMSTRPDILPPAFVQELKLLQDNVSPMSFEEVRLQVEEELGAPLEEIFEEFDLKPIGAASIGQVHRAVTRRREGMGEAALQEAGRECVVKVQRPGIQQKIQADLDILYYLGRFLEVTIQEASLYSPTAVIKEFEAALLQELDFTLEANNIREFRRNFEDVDEVRAPAVFQEYSGQRVLTLEFVRATKLSDIEGGTERARRVLDRLLDTLVKMVLYDGFFHGDPHPGNILVDGEDRLIFIDFGLVGRMSVAQQDEIINLIIAVLSGDTEGITRTLLRMGHPVGRVNLKALKADVVRIRDRYLVSNLSNINVSEFVQEVVEAAQIHKIRLNPTYALLVKTSMTVEGIMRALDPELDILAASMPYARQLAVRRFSARKILQSTLKTGMALSGFVTQIPEQFDQILMDLEGGNLEITMRNEALAKLGAHINTLGTRLFLGMMASALAICAALILPRYDIAVYDVSLMLVVGLICLALATGLFWWGVGWHILGGRQSMKLRLAPFMRFLRRK